MNANNFLKICAGIALVVFSFAFLIQSTSPAVASAPNTGYATGKYMMSMSNAYNGDRVMWNIIVWNTETGKSQLYFGSNKMGEIKAAGSAFNLPASPL